MKLEVTIDLIARHSRGETFFSKGERFSAPDSEARELLERFPRFVRPIPKPESPSREMIVCERASKPDGSPLSAIYWETGDGRILGPAVPEFLARYRDSFWIVTTFDGLSRWINADRLRSKKAFKEQAAVREVELVRF